MGDSISHSSVPRPEDTDRLLTSWKEIAAALGVGVRTAQTYEKEKGLPVRRDGLHVSVSESALHHWQRKRFSPLAWWRRKTVLSLAALAFLLLLSSLLLALRYRGSLWPRSQPVSVRWSGKTLCAYDSAQREVWRRDFPFGIMPDVDHDPGLQPWFGDLDHDGANEIVTLYPHLRRDMDGWDLYCFSSTGETRWRLSVDARVSTPASSYSPPYVLRAFTTFPSPENDKTAWTAAVFVHHTQSPSVLLLVDAQGRRRGEFWQVGHLNDVRAADLDGDGIHELLAAGIQEIPAQAALVILDPRHVAGAARYDPPDPARQFQGMQPGSEKATLYFPRTLLNRKLEPFNFVAHLDIVGHNIQAAVAESVSLGYSYLVYTLTPGLQVDGIAVPTAYRSALLRAGLPPDSFDGPQRQAIDSLKSQVRVVRWR